MKKVVILKNRELLFLLLFISIKGFSQITLKQHNFVSIGDTIVEYYDKFPENKIDVGTPGENKVWDFSNLKTADKDTLRIINPKITPFYNDFPNSNMVLYSNNIHESWMFLNHSKDHLITIGVGYFIDNEKRLDYRNDTIIKFPFKYLDKTSNKTLKEKIITKSVKGLDSIKCTRVWEQNTLVDSWGDIILPTGTFLSLRIKHIINFTEYYYKKKKDEWVLLSNSETNSSTFYQWWTDDDNAKHPVAQIVMDNDHEKPIIIKFLQAKPFLEILEEEKRTNEQKLRIYPVPAKKDIFINLNKEEETYITLYTITGQVVKNITTNLLKIMVNIEGLQVGTYFLITRNKNGQVTGKGKFIKEY